MITFILNKSLLQASCIKIKFNDSAMSICAVYIPSRVSLKYNDFSDFLSNLDAKFIVGDDFNEKHQWWKSKLVDSKERELWKCTCNTSYSLCPLGGQYSGHLIWQKFPICWISSCILIFPPIYFMLMSMMDLSSWLFDLID